ncbi:hypothetical protein DVH24_002080 [Malus domestica]|uniref:Major facilitator superfamily (MFS) profile domain-containing protein n=1 Tax=Malus domestica TaxID=3750 RepID=A0A498I8M3_MALDO|nr:hypothetical protein DVH24_002080 [Malus domestica]
MAGGAYVCGGGGCSYEGGVTIFVIFTCVVAAMGGLLFGYDPGISGGVTSMESFLSKFFPFVFHKMKNETANQNQYCKFDSQLLTLFTSCLYIAALVASFFASLVARKFGRKISMFVAGLVFLLGSILNGIANNIIVLIIGRLLLGIGVGFANQSVPVYLAEMAPTKIRGALNMGPITIGILVAGLVNFGTAKVKGGYGWRVSLALAAVPSSMMTLAAIFLPDTPNSILERGNPEKAKKMLKKIRGTDNVDNEFQDLLAATDDAQKVENQWTNITQPRYRPQLVICILVPFFQQLTGINVIMFYAPVLFMTLGFGDEASLMSAVITGGVNMVATLVSILAVDKFGRRVLFLQAFAWSWGPLGWLVPSEICPLEIRSAGQTINVSVNMLFTFIIGHVFLSMLCHLKFGLFFFFAGFVIIVTIFIAFFLPKTKNVPIEEMNRVWKAHWFWGKYVMRLSILVGKTKL